MIPPKYRFSIVKKLSYDVTKGYGIDSQGKVITAGQNDYLTTSIDVSGCTVVRLDDAILGYNYGVAQYRRDGSLVKSTSGSSITDIYNFALDPDTLTVRIYSRSGDSLTKGLVYGGREINPHYKELNKKYAKESEQEFFRVSLDGKINLFGRDYEIVKNSSLEDQMLLFVDKYNRTSGKWALYYEGEFSKTDCKLDYDKKMCELKTTVVDDYTNVLNKYDNTYDLIKLAPEMARITLHKRSLVQIYVRGANTISNFFQGTYWEDDVVESVDNVDDLVRKYYFAYITSGNEFYISGSVMSDVNGVYAGKNGEWVNNRGYTCYADDIKEIEIPGGGSARAFNVYVKNSSGTVLYKGVQLVTNRPGFDISIENGMELSNPNNDLDKCKIDSPFLYDIYQRLLCDVDSVKDSDDSVKPTYDIPSDDFVATPANYKKCIGLKSGRFFCTTKTVSEPTRYGMNDYGEYFTNVFISSATGAYRPLPISRNSWANASLWYVYDDIIYEYMEEQLRKLYTLKDSYSVAAVIKALLKEIDPTLKHEATAEYSRFLYDEQVPLPMTRFYVYITQKTNILKGNYDQAAQKAEITFEDLMKMLRDCFRCYWYIEDKKFKIEHISYFMRGGSYSAKNSIQLDFTKLKDQFNRMPAAYFQSEIEYDKSDLNSRYEFSWMDDSTDLFDGLTIDVKSNYVQKDKTEDISISQFSSDVDYMLFDPSNFSDDGFALLCVVKNGDNLELPIVKTQLLDENGDRYDAVVQNYYASWAYLVLFYMFDMPAKSIKCNVLDYLPVRDVKMCMEHSIEFPSEEDPSVLELIRTSIGNGRVDEVSVDLSSRHAQVKLVYVPQ